MNEFEWDYEFDPEDCTYNILYYGDIIVRGLTEEQAMLIVDSHNFVLSRIEEDE